MDTLEFQCPHCDATCIAEMVVHWGGVNDYGWWIVRCGTCSHLFSQYVGRDVNDSLLREGGEVLEVLDRAIYTKEDVEERLIRLRETAVEQ